MTDKEKIEEFKTLIAPELSRRELEERIVELYSQNLQFQFMITEGLGWDDMINDIQPMHEF